jgi:hypothetical protein
VVGKQLLGCGIDGLSWHRRQLLLPPPGPPASARLPPCLPCLPGPFSADLGHRMLNNPVIWIGMEREWEIGTQVHVCGGVCACACGCG